MQRLLLAAGLLLLSRTAGAQQHIARVIPIDPESSIRIWNLTGSVRVLGWDRDSLAVEGTIGGAPGAFFFGASGRSAKLGVQSPDDPTQAEPSQLVVRVPRRARVWVKSATADIEVGGLAGGADLNATSGDIRVSGTLQNLNAETMDGSVTLDVTANWLRARTATGNIVLRGGSEDAGLTTVGGRIQVISTGLRRGRFESVTGPIEVGGTLTRDASLSLESHSGGVALTVAPELGAEYSLSTYDGSITTDLVDRQPEVQPGSGTHTLDFLMHGGGAVVAIRTFKGAIQVREGGGRTEN